MIYHGTNRIQSRKYIYTRVDPEIKEQAEAILNRLGIPISNAIGGMTKEQIDMELQKGMDDIAAGRVVFADEFEAELRRLYGI